MYYICCLIQEIYENVYIYLIKILTNEYIIVNNNPIII